jgi:hypothetical protein
MKRALVAMYLMLFCSLPGLADERQQLLGMWKLQTYDVEFQDSGEHKAPFGTNPNGYGIFTARRTHDGHPHGGGPQRTANRR